MPLVHGYFDEELAGLATLTASRLAVHVSIKGSQTPVCDVLLTRAELLAAVERMDALAAEDKTAEFPVLVTHEPEARHA